MLSRNMSNDLMTDVIPATWQTCVSKEKRSVARSAHETYRFSVAHVCLDTANVEGIFGRASLGKCRVYRIHLLGVASLRACAMGLYIPNLIRP